LLYFCLISLKKYSKAQKGDKKKKNHFLYFIYFIILFIKKNAPTQEKSCVCHWLLLSPPHFAEEDDYMESNGEVSLWSFPI
jgi:hypothetical protein